MRVLVLTALTAALAVAAPTPPSTFTHEFEGLKPILALQNGEDAVKTYELIELIFSGELKDSDSAIKEMASKAEKITMSMKNFIASTIAFNNYIEDFEKRFNSMTSEAKEFIRKHAKATMTAVQEALDTGINSAFADSYNLPEEAIASMKAAFPSTNSVFGKLRRLAIRNALKKAVKEAGFPGMDDDM